MDKQIQSYALGFIVGPCINASGRLESAEKALNLFLEEDEEKPNDSSCYYGSRTVKRKYFLTGCRRQSEN